MPFEFQDDVDFNQNEGLRFVVHNSSATPSAGVEGQLYYDTDEKIIYYYDGTAWQAVGSGSGGGVLSGVGPPDPGDGENGQFYINTSNYDIYGPKTLGAWGSPTSLIGPEGPEGDPGADGDDGAPGDDGVDGNTLLSGMGAPGGGTGVNGDFYIDLSTWDIYGPKTAGAWGSGQSLIGPTGGDLPPGGTAGQILIKEGPVDFDADWYDPPNSGSVAWVWDEMATPNYEEDPIEMWIGPEEPQDDGATPNYGDLWFDTSELNNFIPAVASEVVFSDSGLAIITGVSNVQTALAMVDTALVAQDARLDTLEDHWQLIDEDGLSIQSGDIATTATSVTDLAVTQITLSGAQAGDVVHYEPNALVASAATSRGFDAYTYVSGTRTNSFGVGLSASLAPLTGQQAWYCAASVHAFLSGVARRVLVSGDISGGNVVVGMAYVGSSATSRTITANANGPLAVRAQLWRPPS